MSDKNIFFTIHLDENLNVCDFNFDIANAYRYNVPWAINFAKELKIPVINMHMSKGVYFTLLNKNYTYNIKNKEIISLELSD